MKKCWFWILLTALLCLTLSANKPVQASLDSVRVTELKYITGNSVGKPSIDGDLIFWTEQYEKQNHPCYLKISDGSKDMLENTTNNQELIAASQGVLVYRTYGQYHLTVTNISDEVRFGLQPGESAVIDNLSSSGFYLVN